MTFTTGIATIKTTLSTAGYTVLENNLELESETSTSREHYGYTLKSDANQTQFITGSHGLYNNVAQLEVSYLANDNTQYETVRNAWDALLESVFTYHNGYASEPTFKRDESQSNFFIGRAFLYVGLSSC